MCEEKAPIPVPLPPLVDSETEISLLLLELSEVLPPEAYQLEEKPEE